MKNFEGYLKQKFGDSYVLLAGGGHKALSDFKIGDYLPLTGGTLKGGSSTGLYLQYTKDGTSENKLSLTTDNEGGNITIFAPSNKYMTNSPNTVRYYQLDAFDGNFRLYTETNGNVYFKFLNTGYATTSAQGTLWGSSNLTSLSQLSNDCNFITNRGHKIGYRHLDAGDSWDDHKLYIGYGALSDSTWQTNEISFYTSTFDNNTMSRTEHARINSDGLYALTRFGVNGQSTDYVLYVNGTSLFKSILELEPNGSGNEGGELHLCAPSSENTKAGISLDQYNSTFRIFGISSRDGTTKTGVGTPLVIDPYGKKITGGYEITGNASTSSKWKSSISMTIGNSSQSVDGSGNVEWTLANIGAAASSHPHNMNDIKWPGSHNLITSATANNQEWSIDLTPGTYTGTYWQVWRSTTSGISTTGTLLKVDSDTGKVSAPYGFVGNVTGNLTGNVYINRNESGVVKEKAKFYVDSEGGNLRLYSPSTYIYYYSSNNQIVQGDHFWEIDSYNGNLRFYNYSEGDGTTSSPIKLVTFDRNGVISSSGGFSGNLSGTATNADTVDAYHISSSEREILGNYSYKYEKTISTGNTSPRYVKVIAETNAPLTLTYYINTNNGPTGGLLEINCYGWTGFYNIVARRPFGYVTDRVPKVYLVKNTSNGKFDVYFKVVGDSGNLQIKSDVAVDGTIITTEPTADASLDLSGTWSIASNYNIKANLSGTASGNLALSGGQMDTTAQILCYTKSLDTEDKFNGGIQLREATGSGANASDNIYNAPGITFHWAGKSSNKLSMRWDGNLYWGSNKIYNSGNLTNLNQLTNGPGYITSTGHSLGYRHIDAGPKSSWSDSRLYIGYNGPGNDNSITDSIGFYRSTGTGSYTRTLWAEINSDGLYALTRFGVNGQNTSYNFYVNGTSYLNGSVTSGNIGIYYNNVNKISLFGDNEGGNIRIYSKDDKYMTKSSSVNRFWEIDSYDGGLRFYTETDGTTRLYMGTDGILTTSGQGTLWGTSNDGQNSGLNADLLDDQHGSYYMNLSTSQTVTGAKTFTSTLSVGSTGVEGGEIHLEAGTNSGANSYNGIVLDQYQGYLRIFGIPSADGSTRTGVGNVLSIHPYNKTISGNYDINVGKIHAIVKANDDLWKSAIEIREYGEKSNTINWSTNKFNAPRITFHWGSTGTVGFGGFDYLYRITSTTTAYKIWDEGTLTNLNQLTNGPGYITTQGHKIGYRHLDAGPSWDDHRLYVGYAGGEDATWQTNSIGFYRSVFENSAITRTQWAEINSNGLYANTRFGVNGQDTGYNFYVNGTSYLKGTVTATSVINLQTSSKTKLSFAADNEGGNIRIYAPDNKTYTNSSGQDTVRMWEIDAYDGNLRFYTWNDNSTYLGYIFNSNGNLSAGGNIYASNFYTTSDKSKKYNISKLSEHISKFTLKETNKDAYGVIAQEVPEMFREGEEGNMTVNYNSVLSFYIGQLENRVKELEQKIKLLETK